jgi:hypothetical protein
MTTVEQSRSSDLTGGEFVPHLGETWISEYKSQMENWQERLLAIVPHMPHVIIDGSNNTFAVDGYNADVDMFFCYGDQLEALLAPEEFSWIAALYEEVAQVYNKMGPEEQIFTTNLNDGINMSAHRGPDTSGRLKSKADDHLDRNPIAFSLAVTNKGALAFYRDGNLNNEPDFVVDQKSGRLVSFAGNTVMHGVIPPTEQSEENDLPAEMRVAIIFSYATEKVPYPPKKYRPDSPDSRNFVIHPD